MKKSIQLLVAAGLVLAVVNSSCNSPEEKSISDSTTVASESTATTTDPLPSWNEGETKKSIIDYVTKVTSSGSADLIPVSERIAVFDNDGTLWAEQPLYFQFIFSMERIRQVAPQHPEWKNKEPFKSLFAGDVMKALSGGEKSLIAILNASSAGMTGSEFDRMVKEWSDTAKHPVTKKAYTEMIYKPMLELLQYMRSKDFKTFIVSGGDIDFMRAWAEKTYGIPPYQVVGSSMKVQYDASDSVPSIERLPQFEFMDDGPGKPVGIYRHIGQRPVFAAGNSDGDYQMLQWTTTGSGPRMAIIVHHTDSTREWAYDRNSHIGKLDKGLTDAPKYGWKLVDMKNDWKTIFPFGNK